MTKYNGRGVAPGVAMGRAVVAARDARDVRYRLAASGVDRERQRLRAARDRTRQQLEEISARVSRTVGPAQASIFAAQTMMLDDPLLVSRADALIRAERINADWALQRAIEELHGVFAREGDAWLSERVGDLADVSGRLQRNLRPDQDPLADLIRELEPPVIVVARELPASVAAQFDWTRVRGLVCEVGSPTHHTVILARSLGVPVVIGLSGATQAITPGQLLAIDGMSGEVAVDPTEDVQERWKQRAELARAALSALDDLRGRPAVTADGVRVVLEANLEIADEIARVLDAGAEGIGLYRSEFLLDAGHPDSTGEDAQVAVYSGMLAAMAPKPVTIRTFDAGEDRGDVAWRTGGHRDRFGLRGIRSGLQHDERFRTQIRALIRANAATTRATGAGTLRVLLPFVTSAEEMRDARRMIAAIAREAGLAAELEGLPIGAMIEVPAAALTTDALAREADFLSVGTNDLIQYTLAVDRTDERLAGHYEPMAPAVLRLLRLIAVGARGEDRPLSVCGEMAADPLLVSLLVGLGFRRFSMTPSAIPIVKRALLALDSREARTLARHAVRAASAEAVHQLLLPIADAMHARAVGQPENG
ncbi:MAG: phosphoenolpyruvate--protein phosphotransferase [Acidobacteria bacterium]|nr:MAG: phosphoenolpyruvate--protein phosphotransferase [Acidobacteriota bacterium]